MERRNKRPDSIIYKIKNQAVLGDKLSFGEVKSIKSETTKVVVDQGHNPQPSIDL